MEGKTHIVGGLAAGAFYLTAADFNPQEILFFSSCAAGALIPDICHPQSKIGRKLPFLSFLINKSFGHRTLTHSLVFILLALLLFDYTSWPRSIEMGLLIGIESHIVLDALTKDGIQFLWPFNVKVRSPLAIRTGGALEQGFLTLLIVYIGYYGYQTYL